MSSKRGVFRLSRSSVNAEIARICGHYGHSRSLTLTPIERPYATSW